MTKVSVIIPAFNCSKTIVESALSALEKNKSVVDELVIVDDNSEDNTMSVLRSLAKEYPSVRVFAHTENQGGAAARNTAVKNSSGKYIFCLDSDNVLTEGSLSGLVKFAEENQADVAAFRELHFFAGETNNVTHLWRFPPGRFSFADYIAGTVVPGASGNYLFSKSAWKSVGGYRKDSGALDSWVFGLDLVAAEKKMVVAPDGFYLHRYGMESYWVRETKRAKAGFLAAKLIEKYLNRIEEKSQRIILEKGGDWFDQLDATPLKLKGHEVGRAGLVVNKALSMRVRSMISRLVPALR